MVLMLALGCRTPATPVETDLPEAFSTADTGRDCSVPADGEWSVLNESFGEGVLLAAWDAGGTVHLVGGDVAGGPGMLARYDGASLCYEMGVTERPLWWVHGRSRDDWYAVGERGTVLHVVDGVRTREDLPTDITLYGVFDAGTAVWAVGGDPFTPGSGEVWRKGATGWALVQGGIPGVPFKVWEDFVVGDRVGFRIVGDALEPFDQPDRMLTVRGRSSEDAYTVGGLASPLVSRWDGTAWTAVDTAGLGAPLNGVWTAPGEDVWVAGFSGTVARWTGTAWEVPPTPLSFEQFHAAWGTCGEVLFVGGNLLSSSGQHATILRYGAGTQGLSATVCPAP
ncbi:MAG: hypothetical protein R3F61_28590 [Myxococcota bacterium]